MREGDGAGRREREGGGLNVSVPGLSEGCVYQWPSVESTVDIKPSGNHQSQQTSIDTPDDRHPCTQASETAQHTYKLDLIHYFLNSYLKPRRCPEAATSRPTTKTRHNSPPMPARSDHVTSVTVTPSKNIFRLAQLMHRFHFYKCKTGVRFHETFSHTR